MEKAEALRCLEDLKDLDGWYQFCCIFREEKSRIKNYYQASGEEIKNAMIKIFSNENSTLDGKKVEWLSQKDKENRICFYLGKIGSLEIYVDNKITANSYLEDIKLPKIK